MTDNHINKNEVDKARSAVGEAIQDGHASAQRESERQAALSLDEVVRNSLTGHIDKDGLTERELLLKVRQDTKAAETFFHSVLLTLDARIAELD
ncbi:hypothetical protein [Alteromonas gracilis]|uniref:hypothetical protein n=1 Tax=Alteromonas gracilis TaxID=1479524 RepID=UPI003735DC48